MTIHSNRFMSDSHETPCGCHADEERAVKDPAYRRALWIVVLLNLGFGVIEAVGGFIAGSQALKADSLDFLGDGSITFVGLLALSWKERSRARVALIQGCFLAALGFGVLGMAVWRAWSAILPEFEIMGVLGLAGLVVNVSAALALVKFRKQGDANARAIWLFSRNDALANIAVIIAAVLVAWFNNVWPDLIVAGVIAVLFLHSAWEIIRDSVKELRTREMGKSNGRD
jgi:cation diffusion facilitator family transporter